MGFWGYKHGTSGNRNVMTVTAGGKDGGYALRMYTINRVSNSGVTLTCKECSHNIRITEFDDRLGSPRTQAAGAMLKHVLHEHGKVPIGRPLPQVMERWR